jgi:DNA-binding NarL/FixJ family response regulator
MSSSRGDVLLAEDEASLRELHRRGLRRAGFSVLGVGTGTEAAKAFGARTFDVLLADINMPGNANLELLSFIRDSGVSVPVVLMTRQPTIDSAIDALRHGVVDYLTKPVDLNLLLPRLDEAIQKGRTLRALADVKRLAAAFAESVATLEGALCMAGQVLAPNPNRVATDIALDPLAHLAAEVERLSPRELEVARLLALGNAVQDVASTLDLSPNTVRNHVKSVFAKLRVHSQVELLSKLAGHR